MEASATQDLQSLCGGVTIACTFVGEEDVSVPAVTAAVKHNIEFLEFAATQRGISKEVCHQVWNELASTVRKHLTPSELLDHALRTLKTIHERVMDGEEVCTREASMREMNALLRRIDCHSHSHDTTFSAKHRTKAPLEVH